MDEARQESARALQVFERKGDEAGMARAHRLMVFVHTSGCRYAALHDEATAALEYSRRVGDERQEADMIEFIQGANFWGPMPVEHAFAQAEVFIAYAQAKGGRRLLAAAEAEIPPLTLLSGRLEEAKELILQRRELMEELGRAVDANGTYNGMGWAELLSGNLEAAEQALRTAYEWSARMGERGFNSTTAADLGHVLYCRGRLAEALEFAEISREMTDEGDTASQVKWRTVRGQALAALGKLEQGERLAREAVELAETTDSPYIRGSAREALAEVLAHSGRTDEAAQELRQALALYEGKGAVPYTASVRRHLEQLEGESSG
jgi:tetratricopeptide (TPR) repeat protein